MLPSKLRHIKLNGELGRCAMGKCCAGYCYDEHALQLLPAQRAALPETARSASPALTTTDNPGCIHARGTVTANRSSVPRTESSTTEGSVSGPVMHSVSIGSPSMNPVRS